MTKVIMMIMSTQVMLLMINDDDDDDDDGDDDDFDDDGGDEDDDHDDDNNDDQEHHQDYHDSRAGVYDADGHVIPTIGMENNSYNATNSMLFFFSGYKVESPAEILDVLEAAGADLSRVVMSHVDRGILSTDDILRLVKRGCTVLFDQFGWPLSFMHALSHNIDYPSDFVRCKMISELKSHGFLNQVSVHDQNAVCKWHLGNSLICPAVSWILRQRILHKTSNSRSISIVKTWPRNSIPSLDSYWYKSVQRIAAT